MTTHIITHPYSPAVQDYLRAIYQLARRDPAAERVTTSQLAERLGVRPASVTAMLQKMAAAAPALVDYHKSHGARLTADGEKAALAVVRCHRLLELFLHEKLGYKWDEVHEEADRLEHVVSAEMAGRMAEALGHPTRDPHGHVIPAADLSFDQTVTVALRELNAGDSAVVQHVRDEDPQFLRYLDEIGLRPGADVAVLWRDPLGDLLRVQVRGGDAPALGPVVTGQVFVCRRDSQPEHEITATTSTQFLRTELDLP